MRPREERVEVNSATYAIVKVHVPHPEAFAVINDAEMLTMVIEERFLDDCKPKETAKGWKLLTFDVNLPIDFVGFIARISTALAMANIGIFSLTSFARDHILVQENDLEKTITTLKSLGWDVSSS